MGLQAVLEAGEEEPFAALQLLEDHGSARKESCQQPGEAGSRRGLHLLELTAALTWEGTDWGREREVSEVMSESNEMVGKEAGQNSFRKNSGIFLQRRC